MFRFSCSAAARAQPWQSLQIGGQLSGLATQETIREVKLNWLTREASQPCRQSPAPPFNGLEVPYGRPHGLEQADHVSQMGRIGERGDLPASLAFQLTKNSRAGEISVLADFTGLQDSRTASRPLLWALGLSIMYGSQGFQLSISRNHSFNPNLVFAYKFGTEMTGRRNILNYWTCSSQMQLN